MLRRRALGDRGRLLAYVGWIISILMILAGESLASHAVPRSRRAASLLLARALTLATVVFGYKLILRLNRFMVWLAGLALVLTLIYTSVAAMRCGAPGSGGRVNCGRVLGHGIGRRDLADRHTRRMFRTTRVICRQRPPRQAAFCISYLGTTSVGSARCCVGARIGLLASTPIRRRAGQRPPPGSAVRLRDAGVLLRSRQRRRHQHVRVVSVRLTCLQAFYLKCRRTGQEPP